MSTRAEGAGTPVLFPFRWLDKAVEVVIFHLLFPAGWTWFTLPVLVIVTGLGIHSARVGWIQPGGALTPPSPATVIPVASASASPAPPDAMPPAPPARKVSPPPTTPPASAQPPSAPAPVAAPPASTPPPTASPAPPPKAAPPRSDSTPLLTPSSVAEPTPIDPPSTAADPDPSPAPPDRVQDPFPGLTGEIRERARSAVKALDRPDDPELTDVDFDHIRALAAHGESVRPALEAVMVRDGGSRRQCALALVLAGRLEAIAEVEDLPAAGFEGLGLSPTEETSLENAVLREGSRRARMTLLAHLGRRRTPPPTDQGTALIGLLASRDVRLKEALAPVVARLADPVHRTALEAMRPQLEGVLRMAVVRALIGMGARGFETEVSEGLASRSNEVRIHALHAVRDESNHMVAAHQALEDPDYLVKIAAAGTLLEQGDTSGQVTIRSQLASAVDDAREGIFRTLRDLSERSRTREILRLVGDRTLPGAIRVSLIELLASCPDRSATATIQRMLAHRSEAVRRVTIRGLHLDQIQSLARVLRERIPAEDDRATKLMILGRLRDAGVDVDDLLIDHARTGDVAQVARILARNESTELASLVVEHGSGADAAWLLPARILLDVGSKSSSSGGGNGQTGAGAQSR